MITTNKARVQIATGDDLDVRHFSVRQAVSELFRIQVEAVSSNLDIDFDDAIGADAGFELFSAGRAASWTGICLEAAQVRVDDQGLATYEIVIVPRAWLLTQRTNYRIFQYASELEIVRQLLSEWGIAFEARTALSAHKARKLRTQYGESDFVFLRRMLEDAGTSFYFEAGDGETKLVLDDEPQARALAYPMLRFHDQPDTTDGDFVTKVAARGRLRPGRVTIGDLDYRKPSVQQPRLSRGGGLEQEQPLEQFDWEPGAFLYQAAPGGSTPAADDRGAARTDEAAGARKVENRLAGRRNDAKRVSFESNVLELAPGTLLSIVDHPHRIVDESAGLLVVSATLVGTQDDSWRVQVEAVPTDAPFRPAPVTPKPEVRGLESATVVGPASEEIHTDEYGRVRVHFHWDRESRRDATSSCWVPTNQPWAGDGFGGVNLPRIGQEVVIEFLNGDPDRPVVMGRVYTETNPVPDPLPKYKQVSGLFSESTPRLVMGGATGDNAAPAPSQYGGTPMSSQDIAAAVTNEGIHQAPSPTGTNHQWQGSGMKLDDKNGVENFYLQANKDMHWVVRNNWTTVVGNFRAARMGTDEIVRVKGNQAIKIGSDQETLVQRNSTHVIKGSRKDTVKQKFTQTATKTIKVESRGQNMLLQAEDTIKFKSEEGIELRVKGSFVKIQPELVVVDGGDSKVHINPAYRVEAYWENSPPKR